MNIGVIDAAIILFVLLGGVIGFKEGVIKKTVSIIGVILVVILSFTLKNELSVFFYENLPFVNLWGAFKGIQVLNVIFYELLAFVIISSLLSVIYNVLLKVTGLIEMALKATVILSIPSKILGFIVGLFEGYIWVYVILFVLSLPILNTEIVNESKLANKILGSTPILSGYTEKTIEVYDNIHELIVNRNDKTNIELNEETLDLMLRYDVITEDSVTKLINGNKVDVSNEYHAKHS